MSSVEKSTVLYREVISMPVNNAISTLGPPNRGWRLGACGGSLNSRAVLLSEELSFEVLLWWFQML